jgi:hypothetical protein
VVHHRGRLRVGGGVPSGAPPGGGSLPTADPESYTPPPPPPPPPPVNLNAEITRLSTGPYGAGDSVRVTAQVITSSGKLRPAQAGEIIVRGPDGRERARVPVRPLPSGQVVALVKLPENTVGNLQLEFVPRGIALQVDETMGTVTGKQHSLRLSSCRLRGHILEPTRGEVVVPESIILLSGELRDKAGQKVSASTLSVLTKPIFIAERADGQTQRHNGSVEADGKISGRMWLKPTSADSEEVLLHLIGEGGPDGELCSAGTTALKLTKLGIGLEILEPQPDGICYTGKPCRVVAQFKLPSSGDAKRNAEAWLRTPGLTLIAKINGDPVTILRPTTLPNGRQAYADSFMPKHPLSMEIEVVVKAGGQEVSDRQRVTIREPIALKLPSELDLGQVPVGSSWRINCGKIDFSKSTGVDEQEFQFHVELPPGCKSELGIADAFGRFLPFASSGAAGDSGDRRLVLGLDRSVKLCLTPPRCAGEKLAPAIVKIKPTSPEFAMEQAVVAVKWQVKGRGFPAVQPVVAERARRRLAAPADRARVPSPVSVRYRRQRKDCDQKRRPAASGGATAAGPAGRSGRLLSLGGDGTARGWLGDGPTAYRPAVAACLQRRDPAALPRIAATDESTDAQARSGRGAFRRIRPVAQHRLSSRHAVLSDFVRRHASDTLCLRT